MTALGIDASDRDPVTTWAEITPARRWHNPFAAAYKEAWDRYDQEVERQLAAGGITDKALLDEMAEAAGHILKLAERANNQHNCAHYWVHQTSGGLQMIGGDLVDNTIERVVCARCELVKGDRE